MNYQTYTQQLMHIRAQLPEALRNQFLIDFDTRTINPTIVFGFSLFLGGIGIDRFIAGDWGKGILKLITLGGLFIWTFVDWFLITGRVRQKNIRLAEHMLAEAGVKS